MKLLPSRSLLSLLPACALLAVPMAHADVRLPALVSDNMVLMQDTPANVWGWADPQEPVTVKLAGKAATAAAGADGKWSVKLDGLQPGVAGDLTIIGKNTLTVKNVAVGEVWAASGQSNMELPVSRAMNLEQETAAADHPQIRMFTVTKKFSTTPLDDCKGAWEICTPQTVPHFSAVGYFFARHLQQNLQIPIGIIHTSWGGTPAEFWTPVDALAGDPELSVAIPAWEETKKNYPAAKAKYDAEMETWKAANEQAKKDGKAAPKPPRAPRGGDDFGAPGCLFNAMIAPVLPYTIRGVIWYQGEANARNAKAYEKLFPTMIETWRQRWGIGEFPFLFVQLANFMKRYDTPTDSNWAALRDAQLKTLELRHTGMAVIIDIGEADNIHPKNKQEVGRRLALNALATVYYVDTDYSGPLFGGAQQEENKVRVTFRFAEGMKTSDGGAPKGFAVAGEDKVFHWANGEIQGDHVVLECKEVPEPVAIRYAWADNPECNIVNGAGLPASPFRTDDWPQNERPPTAKR